MLLLVQQTDSSTNSVTINVSKITEGYRQTYIWLTAEILNSNKGSWYTLYDAKEMGKIYDYITIGVEDENGFISVVVSDEYLELGYRIVRLRVENVNTSSGDLWININTTLRFEYDGSEKKVAGEDVDITVNDMKKLYLFGCSFNLFVLNKNSASGYDYSLDYVVSGDPIYAKYLQQPAQIMRDAVNLQYFNVSVNCILSLQIFENEPCTSGADFKAEYFNYIASAINNYKETINKI